MPLADGNRASVGDLIITRGNDRRLRVAANDWVKNGDRWIITRVAEHGDLTVRHTRSHLTVRLPIDCVRASTGLGYAATIHSAQGVSADTETGEHPLRHMLTAASGRNVHTAGDMAAVLYWRRPELASVDPGPLPWLPGIPETLQADPVWGDYLAKRSQLVADLADQVQDHLCQADGPPVWAAAGSHPSTALIREITVWRAATGINPQDPRPTGEGGQLDRDQPEKEANLIQSPPCGNSDSNCISPGESALVLQRPLPGG